MTLAIRQIAFERNHHFLFSDIHCELNAGELLQIRGANGSGKSTLLRLLAGFIEPHQGSVSWRNQSIHHERDLYQQELQYLGHQNGIKPYLTLYENILLNAALASIRPHSSQIKTAIKQMGLDHLSDQPAMHLSAGQLRRLSLIRLLLRPAAIWLLDEPATALDQEGQIVLVNLLNQHLAKGGMAILATHQLLPLTHTVKTIILGSSDVS